MINLNDELSERLRRIESKIDSMQGMLQQFIESEKPYGLLLSKPLVRLHRNINAVEKVINIHLLKLPDSLRRTMFVMGRLGEATTERVARETGRSRSVESIHLNQLERMGYLEKYRKGRKIYFRIPSPPKD